MRAPAHPVNRNRDRPLEARHATAGRGSHWHMKCVVCRQGETRPGKTTLVLQRGGATVVINDVPAHVCENCGEEYVNGQVAEHVLASAESAARAGVRVEIRVYVPA